MTRIHFESPWAFLLLLVLAALLLYRWHRRSSVRAVMPTLSWLNIVNPWWPKLWIYAVETGQILFLVGLIFVLARPQTGSTETERLSEGIDIILAIDTSESMKALDFFQENKRVDRLTVVKAVAKDFVDGRDHDRLGVVVFGDNAFTQCPPTYDHASVNKFLDWLFIGMAGSRTAIGEAIAISSKRLEKIPGKSKVIILLTDGRNTVEDIDPLQAASVAAALGIRIYTIGVGSNDPVPIPVDGMFGSRLIQRKLELDEELLKTIAFKTGGLYFNAQNMESLKAIYDRIDELEKSEVRIREYRNYDEIYFAWLQPLLIFFVLLLILNSVVVRRIP